MMNGGVLNKYAPLALLTAARCNVTTWFRVESRAHARPIDYEWLLVLNGAVFIASDTPTLEIDTTSCRVTLGRLVFQSCAHV